MLQKYVVTLAGHVIVHLDTFSTCSQPPLDQQHLDGRSVSSISLARSQPPLEVPSTSNLRGNDAAFCPQPFMRFVVVPHGRVCCPLLGGDPLLKGPLPKTRHRRTTCQSHISISSSTISSVRQLHLTIKRLLSCSCTISVYYLPLGRQPLSSTTCHDELPLLDQKSRTMDNIKSESKGCFRSMS